MEVCHKVFGLGTVKNISDSNIIVSFKKGDKKFQFPQAFNGFLTTEDPELLKQVDEAKNKLTQKVIGQNTERAHSRVQNIHQQQKPRVYSSNNPLIGERAQTIAINSQHFFLGFFPDTPLPVLTSVVICHSFFLQSI